MRGRRGASVLATEAALTPHLDRGLPARRPPGTVVDGAVPSQSSAASGRLGSDAAGVAVIANATIRRLSCETVVI